MTVSRRVIEKLFRTAALALTFVTLGCRAVPQNSFFADWPKGASPQEVGRRVAENFLDRPFDFETNSRRRYVIYPEVCAWYGSLTTAELMGDKELTTRLIKKFDPLLTTEAAHISPDAHVDYHVFGVVPLQIYLETHDPKFLKLGKSFADKQWENPTPDGITREARYWVDDMYMISAVQVQAFRATHDKKYLDRAALTLAAYLDKLQQPNGLFYHADDSPFFWCRGNGWCAAGMAEVLSELPPGHPQYDRIMAGYKKMMAALLKYQSDDGLWRELIDHPESWVETSGTGMCAFAMVTGVKRGWLDANTYGPAARKAWLGLVAHLDKNANVTDVCVGTNKAAKEVGTDSAVQLKYYLDRGRSTGDLHGQAPILWTASALMR
ncbi:MAG TPA: glycoside hydrolase family 88 protein [Verrucomicrobiae bacterium]|nr:glycoside hydrolase family 88 protein [Verrucomicrobiae bacterium]